MLDFWFGPRRAMFILRGAVTVCLFLANLAFSQYLSGLVRRAGAQKNRHAQHRADAQSRVPRTAQRLRCRLDHDTRVKIPVENRLASLETGIHFGNGHTLWKRAYKGILEHIPEETAGEIFAQTCSEDNAALFGTPRQVQREYFATIPLQPYLSHA